MCCGAVPTAGVDSCGCSIRECIVLCCRIRLNKRRQKSKSLMNTQLVVHHRALNNDEAATQVGREVDDEGVGQGLALVLTT